MAPINKPTLVARIRREVREAVGCFQHTSERTLSYLEEHGLSLYSGAGDLVLFEVYQDRTTSGVLLTRGDIVIPGREILDTLPESKRYGCHFLKTFTLASPPLRRGETPRMEFERTMEVIEALGPGRGRYIEPIAFGPLEYRSRAIPGVTYASQSSFRNLSYERSIEVGSALEKADVIGMAQRLFDADDHIRTLHEKGFVHGDLHPDNIMTVTDRDGKSWSQMIDFASAVHTSGFSPTKVAEMQFDDRIEFLREIALLQIARGETFDHPMAEESLEKADDLFPDEIAELARGVRGMDR